MSCWPTRSSLGYKAVKTTSVNWGATVAVVWDAKVQPQPQTDSNSQLSLPHRPTWACMKQSAKQTTSPRCVVKKLPEMMLGDVPFADWLLLMPCPPARQGGPRTVAYAVRRPVHYLAWLTNRIDSSEESHIRTWTFGQDVNFEGQCARCWSQEGRECKRRHTSYSKAAIFDR